VAHQRIALHALFLQPKGKIVTDAFIFQPRVYSQGKAEYAKEELWIDLPREAKATLKQHLHRHMWKKKVELHDVEAGDDEYKPTIYSGYVTTPPSRTQKSPSTRACAAAPSNSKR
jgi:folate-binding Fe-S cluster repair protein YgfZ